MCHPKGRSAAKDARSALTRRPARSYSAPTIPATVRHARRRSGERHERSIPRPPGAASTPRRPADRASTYPHPFEESLKFVMRLRWSLHQMLQVLQLNMFERRPLQDLFTTPSLPAPSGSQLSLAWS